MARDVTDAELERRKAICRACQNLATRGGVVFCKSNCHKPGGKYCEPWAASQYRKLMMAAVGCPKWSQSVESFLPLPDNPTDGVLIVSIGSGRRQWLFNAIASVRRHRPDLGIHVVSDVPVDVPFTWVSRAAGKASRHYKTLAHRLSPFPGLTLMFDDDAVMHRPLPPLGELLGDADLAAKVEPGCATVAATCRAGRHRWIREDEKQYTASAIDGGCAHYNSGVVVFRKSPAVMELFDCWHEEWKRFRDIDQLALSRAMAAVPVAVQRLGEEYNFRSERRDRNRRHPYVFHFHRKGDNLGWYHPKFAEPAATHLSYAAFSRAVDHGQLHREQYEATGKPLWERTPLRLLVWGCGEDSELWQRLNRGGRTLFIESDPKWAARARQVGCDVLDVTLPTRCGTQAPESMDRPAGLDREWDAVIIDGPPGRHSHVSAANCRFVGRRNRVPG